MASKESRTSVESEEVVDSTYLTFLFFKTTFTCPQLTIRLDAIAMSTLTHESVMSLMQGCKVQVSDL